MPRRMLAITAIAALHLQTASAGDRWEVYGVQPDGSKHSWNKDDYAIIGDQIFELTSRSVFTSPQPIPGGNKLPPASVIVTRDELNCATGAVQHIKGSFFNEAGDKITGIDKRGPLYIADAAGAKVRDRLYDSFCAAIKKYKPPSRMP